MVKIGIVGYGVVGRHLYQRLMLARPKEPAPIIYDPAAYISSTKEEINKCDIVFVAVPTQPNPDGSCDTNIVEDVVSWITGPVIVIRSTIPVGFTNKLKGSSQKRIVFQPEFLGETVDHPMNDDKSHIVLGGDRKDTQAVADFYQTIYNAYTKIIQTDAKTAELLKYMRNSFFAMKVIFCNEFFDIATDMGIDYHELRELFILDPRTTPSHTFVYPEKRGYDGKCFPKDVKAIIYQANGWNTDVTLLKAINKKNTEVYKK